MGRVAVQYNVMDPLQIAKLRVLIQRAVFPNAYHDIVKKVFCCDTKSTDTQFMYLLSSLRNRPPASLEMPISWTQNFKFQTALLCASDELSYLPFQLVPYDMLLVIDRTLSCLCTAGKVLLRRSITPDELALLLQHVILNTDLPGLHESLWMMNNLIIPPAPHHREPLTTLASLFQYSVSQVKSMRPGPAILANAAAVSSPRKLT